MRTRTLPLGTGRRFLPMRVLCPRPACAEAARPKIGICIYNAADTFMSSVVRQIEREASASAEVITMDSENDQNLQCDQVQEMLDANVDALIIQPRGSQHPRYTCCGWRSAKMCR